MRHSSRTPFQIADLPELFSSLAALQSERETSGLAIAHATMAEAVLPPDVTATPYKFTSRRMVVKGPRPYSNIRAMTAHWPADGLMEAKGIPKMAFVAVGHCDFPVGHYVIHCHEGHFIICPSGIPHPDGSRPHLDEQRQKAGAACCLVWFQAWETGIRCWSCCSQGSEHFYQDKRHLFILNEQVHQVFNLLCEEAANRRRKHDKVCKSLLTAFVTMMDRELRDARYHLSYSNYLTASLTTRAEGNRDPISLSQEYIRSHLNQQLTIESVARKVLMSRAQFTKRFRRETGKTFMEFLTECRLEHAKKLLRESDWTALNISAQAGFKSYSHFGELFKNQLDMTPGEFRKQARSESPLPDPDS